MYSSSPSRTIPGTRSDTTFDNSTQNNTIPVVHGVRSYAYSTQVGSNYPQANPVFEPPSVPHPSNHQASNSQTRRKRCYIITFAVLDLVLTVLIVAVFGWVYSKYGGSSWFSTTKVIYGFGVSFLIIGVALIEAVDIRFLFVSSLKEKSDLATARFISWIIYFIGEICFYIDYIWFTHHIETEPESHGTYIVLWLLVALGAVILVLTGYNVYRSYSTMRQSKKDASLQERIYSSANI
eukprot:jgi/Galph1/2452/GphlegSOOS_G1134.1